MNKSRVLVLGSFAESLTNFRGPFLRAMVKRGHQVLACTPDGPPAVRAALRDWGVEFRSVPMDRTGSNPLKDALTVERLRRLMVEVSPDVFFGYTVKPVIYGGLAARIAGVPRSCPMITGITHTFLRRDLRGRVLGALAFSMFRVALRDSHCVFFQNPDDLQEFVDRGALDARHRPVLVNGSGVDVEYFSPAPTPDVPSFLLVARLIHDKGIREYVDAARIIKRSYPAARFRLVGWFDDKPTSLTETDIASWTDEGTIEFLGRLEDVRPAIADTAVYVLPSYREGTPRTVLEAMAMARPIITTDTPGCRETVVEGVNGMLVPVGEVQPLAAAMERFIREPSLVTTMGRESRRMAEQRYDVNVVNATLLREMGL